MSTYLLHTKKQTIKPLKLRETASGIKITIRTFEHCLMHKHNVL